MGGPAASGLSSEDKALLARLLQQVEEQSAVIREMRADMAAEREEARRALADLREENAHLRRELGRSRTRTPVGVRAPKPPRRSLTPVAAMDKDNIEVILSEGGRAPPKKRGSRRDV